VTLEDLQAEHDEERDQDRAEVVGQRFRHS
jgi:hypothetical protein